MINPLNGIRVLDLSRVLSGPFCTSMLADMGAEVLKIEDPGLAGDGFRMPDGVTTNNGVPQIFIGVNRGKKGLTLNLKSEEGKSLFLQLIEKSDVVVQNFRPGVMDKLGLGYEKLKSVNSNIIMASISGYGKNSPNEKSACYDIIAQGVVGVMSVTGSPGDDPMRMPLCLGDTITGLYCALGIVSALRARDLNKVGQEVEVAMVDSLFSMCDFPLYSYLATGENPQPFGNAGMGVTPHGAYKAIGGHYMMSCYEPVPFGKMCRAIGRPELAEAERFADIPTRFQHIDELTAIINDWSSSKPLDEVLIFLIESGIACGPINDIEGFANSEHIEKREMLTEIDHPVSGKVKVHSLPIKFSETPAKIERSSPQKGEHTAALLKDILGMSAEEVEQAYKSNII